MTTLPMPCRAALSTTGDFAIFAHDMTSVAGQTRPGIGGAMGAVSFSRKPLYRPRIVCSRASASRGITSVATADQTLCEVKGQCRSRNFPNLTSSRVRQLATVCQPVNCLHTDA